MLYVHTVLINITLFVAFSVRSLFGEVAIHCMVKIWPMKIKNDFVSVFLI